MYISHVLNYKILSSSKYEHAVSNTAHVFFAHHCFLPGHAVQVPRGFSLVLEYYEVSSIRCAQAPTEPRQRTNAYAIRTYMCIYIYIYLFIYLAQSS